MKKKVVVKASLTFALLIGCLVLTPNFVQADERQSYSLTPVEENYTEYIAKPVYNEQTGYVDAEYYKLDLTKKEYGSGSNTAYFETNYRLLDETDVSTDRTLFSVKYDDRSEFNSDGFYVDYGETVSEIVNDYVARGDAYNYNSGHVGLISGNYIGNNGNKLIYNKMQIDRITGVFAYNYYSAGPRSLGSNKSVVIYNEDTIGEIDADFLVNQTAIQNNGSITSIKGDFVGNNLAIANNGEISNINANFIMNDNGTIVNAYGSSIGNIQGNFKGNSSYGYNLSGGAITNYSKIDKISANFEDNTVLSSGYATGGAILNSPKEIDIFPISYDLQSNVANNKTVGIGEIVNSNFINNGAVFFIPIAKSLSSRSFSDGQGGAYGGAIFSTDDINIVADNGVSEFTGNYVINQDGVKDNQAIYMASPSEEGGQDGIYYYEDKQVTLNLTAKNNGKIIMNDKISGNTINANPYDAYMVCDADYDSNLPVQVDKSGNPLEKNEYTTYKLNIDGDSTGVVYLNNDVESSPLDSINLNGMRPESLDEDNQSVTELPVAPVEISLSNTTLHLGVRDNVINNNNLTLNSGTFNMVNNQVGIAELNRLTVAGNTNMIVDVDLAKQEMDRFTAKEYGEHTGKLTVSGMNLLSDSRDEKTEIYFAEKGLKGNVQGELALPDGNQTVFSPIYKYDVKYDNRDDAGYFVFDRRASNPSNPSESFNPSVLATPVATQAGAYATQNQTFNYAFQNSDNFMNIPYLERVAIKNQNKYAMSPNGDATDVGAFSPLLTKPEGNSVWFKPYASFENIPLKNGPKVDNINYGTLVGFDSELKEVRGGFDRVMTYYLGYNGSYQSYSGVDSMQNGGLIGTTATFYKGNFFNATTLSVGASAGTNDTLDGHENFALLLAGIGNKTGYNIEFKEGRIILQPNFLISYTFVNTFDYTNARGVDIKSDPLNAIQLAPGLKVIGNTKNGWQPYASVSMVWNLLDKSRVTADDVRLPEMSIKPYVQYGLGIQRRFMDRFLGFGQAMIQNGGRNGVALSFGLRVMLGK